MKQVTLPEILTQRQIKAAHKIYRECRDAPGTFAKRCADEVIGPEIQKINARLGQENDPLYLAYLCEYVFNETNA